MRPFSAVQPQMGERLRPFALMALVFAVTPGCTRQPDGDTQSTRATRPPVEVQPLAVLDSALIEEGLTIEYRWEARETETVGTSLPVYFHPALNKYLSFSDSVAFDLSGAIAVRILQEEDGASVILELSQAGQERLVQTTSTHAEEWIGVLVNGHVVTVAGVQSAMWNMLPVVHRIPYEQAETLAIRINAALVEE